MSQSNFKPNRPCKAFHPFTLGVVHPGVVVATKGEKVQVDFSPITFKGKTKFWVHESDIVACAVWGGV